MRKNNIIYYRLYVKGIFAGFRRGKRSQNENQALVKIEGLNSRKEAAYYLGKRLLLKKLGLHIR